MGDSISAGVGANSRAVDSYFALLYRNADATWPEESETDLASRFGDDITLVNVAQGGATAPAMRRLQVARLENQLDFPVQGHSIAVITIGGNDLQGAIVTRQFTGSVMTNALASIRETVEFLQDAERFPDGVSIYLAAVYDPSDGVGFIQGCFFNLEIPDAVAALDVWRDEYIALGEELGFAVVDVLGAFHGHGLYATDPNNEFYDTDDPTQWFDGDCIHPNPRGHNELRRLFFESIDGEYVAD